MENMNNYIQIAPLILVIGAFFIQYKIFVTPEALEKKHREIIEDVESKFATNQSVFSLKEQLVDMKEKLDKIYDYIINK
ncbi:MAG: hypothetical protein PHN38_09745 [Sulfurospirillaceae bacterium]|nr:hypothetical protein [Sulfurospirillaceae bacterium]